MNPALAAGSLAAVLALAGIAWALGFGQSDIGSEEDAVDRFAELLPQFPIGSVWVAHDWKTALALGDRRIAILRSHGSRFVAIDLPRTALHRTGRDDFVIRTDDRAWRTVRFGLPVGQGDALQSALDEVADKGVSSGRV